MLDGEFPRVSNIFIPDIPGGFESIEISCASLEATKRLKIGSGVIRLLEHDEHLLQRRLETIQSVSRNRFVLGVGTGSPGKKAAETIEMMMGRLENIRTNFGKMSDSSGVEVPETYVATLRSGIARRVAGKSTGILLNFCSPEFASEVVKDVSTENNSAHIDFACYLKVFYAKDKQVSDRLLIEEFAKYDSIGPYHKVFEKNGVDTDIQRAKDGLMTKAVRIPDSLLKISLSNPSNAELKTYVDNFRGAGVTLPCIYPYFSGGDDMNYRKEIIREIAKTL